ncbi:MAG: hypothetical protein GJ676_18985 [Rhodobacteraceae bacterium]|nr:hypothetical protein [Paracoccaceae bacterium]
MTLTVAASSFTIGTASTFTAGTFPDSAVLNDGTIAVTFSQTTVFATPAVPDADGAVFVRLLNADGTPKGSLIQVNTTEAGGQGPSQVVALKDGGFAVSWINNAPLGSGHNDSDVHLRIFNANGTPRTGEIVVTVDTPTPGSRDDDNTGHTLTALANGNILVAWSDGGPVEGIFSQQFTAAGVKTGAELKLAGDNAILTDSTQLTTGEILHGFLGGAIRLGNTDTILGGAEARFTRVAALSNGGYVVAYEEFASTSVSNFHIHVFNGAGTQLKEIILPSEGTQVAPILYDYDLLGLEDGGFVFAYPEADSSGRGIKALSFDNAGTQVGNEVSIPPSETSDQTSQTLAELSNGDVFAAYLDGGQTSAGDFLQGVTIDVTGVGSGGPINGSNGRDRLDGTAGNDVMNGLRGPDRIFGKNGDDTLNGGLGRDALFGGNGRDLLFGNAGSDWLNGGFGNDVLRGQGGNDILKGHAGRDLFFGGRGNDTHTGGPGADRFVFRTGDGIDTITDFQVGTDRIVITAGADDIDDLTFQTMGSDVHVTFSNVTIIVDNTTVQALDDTGNFLF